VEQRELPLYLVQSARQVAATVLALLVVLEFQAVLVQALMLAILQVHKV
jgi:hypothetical protein